MTHYEWKVREVPCDKLEAELKACDETEFETYALLPLGTTTVGTSILLIARKSKEGTKDHEGES